MSSPRCRRGNGRNCCASSTTWPASPAQQGDYQEVGATDRIYEVKLSGDLLLTWWVDHAAKEVRIVRIERVE